MAKTDDHTLDQHSLQAVQQVAQRALDRASACGRYPTPIQDILEAANLRVAPVSMFDPARLIAYLKGKTEQAGNLVKSAIAKVFGVYDGHEQLIHIDQGVRPGKQNFLKLHEAGHHEMPTHRKLFRFFEDCEKTLDPEVSDQFEREANNFARYTLFQGDGYREIAADHAFEIKTPMKLAKKFGASVYASCREYARTHHRACAVYVLEPVKFCERSGARADVRRIEVSRAFLAQFGRPADPHISLEHALGSVLPMSGRKMTRPRTISIADRNGQAHECVAEAFDTTFNVIILVYPVKALTATRILIPAS